MIILDATTKSLQFTLSGTVATNQLPFSASYVDSTGTATTPGEQDGVSNNTTAVNVVSAPASSTQRLIKNIIIQNADTAAATVTIIYNNNSTLRNIFVATLAVGDQLIYEDGRGWMVVDINGNLKTLTQVNKMSGAFYVLGKSAVQSSHTGNTSETILATITIPAGAMGANGVIRYSSIWTFTNNANAKTINIRLGGIGGTAISTLALTTGQSARLFTWTANRNSQASQVSWPAGVAGWGSNGGGLTPSVIDTSVSTTLVFTGTLANSGDTISLEQYMVELCYGA